MLNDANSVLDQSTAQSTSKAYRESNAETTDQRWMSHALELARRAHTEGEVPVGAVVVRDGIILGSGWNRPLQRCDPTAHAEIEALRAAANLAGNYRLPDATLYSTLEPCVMCAGALIHARIARLVFATPDPRSGAIFSQFNLLESSAFNHRISWEWGLLREECAAELQNFFRQRRSMGRT